MENARQQQSINWERALKMWELKTPNQVQVLEMCVHTLEVVHNVGGICAYRNIILTKNKPKHVNGNTKGSKPSRKEGKLGEPVFNVGCQAGLAALHLKRCLLAEVAQHKGPPHKGLLKQTKGMKLPNGTSCIWKCCIQDERTCAWQMRPYTEVLQVPKNYLGFAPHHNNLFVPCKKKKKERTTKEEVFSNAIWHQQPKSWLFVGLSTTTFITFIKRSRQLHARQRNRPWPWLYCILCTNVR